MKNKKTTKKATKKAKKPAKKLDLSKIPENFPDGVAIPQWVREAYASGAIPMSSQDKPVDAQPPSADTRTQDAAKSMPGETWSEAGEKLSESEMNQYLKEFYRSNAFRAYKQYIGHRLQLVTDSMFSTDPYKEATKMAQQQGIRQGLIDVEGYIISLLELEKSETQKNQQ